MKHRRGGSDDGGSGPCDVRDIHGEVTERLPRIARGTDHGIDSVVRTVDEGVMIAKVVQDNIAVSITELRALAERAAASGPHIAHRVDRSLVSLLSAQRLVGEMVDLACLEAARLVLRREPTELSGLVTETVDHCVIPAQRRSVQIDSRHSTRCRVDRERVARVIGSFLQAAVTYGYPSSPIVIRIEEMNHRASVSMANVGPGMTTTQARAIFEKRQTLPTRGNGIGLFVSRKIVEAHGGAVEIDTIPSVGTTFAFRLPVMA